jgi:hypothetical protein
LQKDIEEASAGTVEKKEVPFGDYEVKITKLELGENTFEGDYKGMPEIHVWFKIISEGEYKNQMLFMNKRLVSLKNPKATGFLIHKVNEFLDSLESGIPVVFENFEQYGGLIKSIFEAIDGRAEYQLAFFENKGYKDYAIVKRFQ